LTHIIFLALGTNLGERLQNLRAAINAFGPQIRVLEESRVYETEPWGYADQPAFLNMVVRAETDLSPRDLLDRIKELESSLGRIPNFRNGPRLIDLDILFYDDLILNTPGLVIPHPRLQERAFVAVPLADVAHAMMHPVSGHGVAQIVESLDRQGVNEFTG
jgi:2-amino-4-hydroxy-6-hydroxymethyldihydropteridine diphosphokinase